MAAVLIADDHPLFREALIGALAPLLADFTILQASNLPTTLDVLAKHKNIQLLLLDLNMPGGEHFAGVISVRQNYPHLPVAIISADESPTSIATVMAMGVRGYITKSMATADIGMALRTILAGQTWAPDYAEHMDDVDDIMQTARKMSELTPKQVQVLQLLSQGFLNKQIADQMFVTEATVKAHISAIFRKLEVSTRTQAVVMMQKLQQAG